MAQALTYWSGPKARDLRTVVVEDVHRSVVLLPAGRLDVVTAKLLHGTSCRCRFWAEVLDSDPDTISVPADAVVAQREIKIAAKVVRAK